VKAVAAATALQGAFGTVIFMVHCNHGVLGKQFAHPDEAQISQVGLAILVSFRQLCQVPK
jgi:hypothetical protein